MEENLKTRPARSFEETPCPGGENEGIPSSDCECADEEVLVCAEMGRKIERGREEGGDVWSRHGGMGVSQSSTSDVITTYNPAANLVTEM